MHPIKMRPQILSLAWKTCISPDRLCSGVLSSIFKSIVCWKKFNLEDSIACIVESLPTDMNKQGNIAATVTPLKIYFGDDHKAICRICDLNFKISGQSPCGSNEVEKVVTTVTPVCSGSKKIQKMSTSLS